MANAVSNLIIKLQDQLSGPAAKAAGSLDKLEAAGKDLKKIGGSTAQIEKLTADLAKLNAQAGKIGEFRDASRALDQAGLAYRKAQQDVRKLAAEIAATDRPTRQMKASFERAKREAASAATAFKQQGQAVRSMRSALDGAGIPVKGLASAEQNLKSRIDSATQSIERQRAALASLSKQHTSAASVVRGGTISGRSRLPLHGAPTSGVSPTAMMAGLGAAAAGAGLPMLGGAGVIYGGVAAARSALSFERAMYEVQKATDATGDGLRKYENTILDLARATGKTKEELAGMFAAAGFAGRPTDELARFTEYGAKATVAWGTSADETGQALAELGNIYNAHQARIEEIGDAINTAADVSASRESDLLDFLRRAGASANQAGISAEHTLAFGAALKEVGVRSEVAATGFEALLNMMKLGEEFSKEAGDGLKELGVSSTRMRKSFVAKPVETMVALLERLNKVKDPLKKAEIMTNLFGKEYQDDISKLLNSLPRLNDLLKTMGDRSKYIGSVRQGFDLISQKDFNRLDRATQALDVLAVRGSNAFKLIAGGAAEEINKLVDGIEKGDNLFQRIFKRLEAYEREQNGGKDPGPKPLDVAGKWIYDNVVPYIPIVAGYNALDEWAGATGDEAEQKGREAAVLDRIEKENAILEKARALREQQASRKSLGLAPAPMIESQLQKIEGRVLEIALRRHVEGLGINQTGGNTKPALGGGASFGFGVGGVPDGTENRWGADPTAPLPPVRPDVDTTDLEAAKGKAAEAEQAIQGLNVTVAPSVDLASLRETDALLGSILGKLGQIGPASQRARTSVAQIGAAQQPSPLQPGGVLQREKNGLYANT
jgi:TP901 family phage tail tape measure protein